MDSERLAWFDNICIFLQFAFCDIYVLGLLNVMKQIKQAQPVLDMEKKNHKHEAYLKSIKSSIKKSSERYLIFTGARSPLTALINPQYIALHMSQNPRSQYYSKPE